MYMVVILELHLVWLIIVIFYLVWFMVVMMILFLVRFMVVMVILYLVWFMVVMVILPSSSKQTWPALGGSTEEQSKNLATNTVILRYSRFTLWTHKEADQKHNHKSFNLKKGNNQG